MFASCSLCVDYLSQTCEELVQGEEKGKDKAHEAGGFASANFQIHTYATVLHKCQKRGSKMPGEWKLQEGKDFFFLEGGLIPNESREKGLTGQPHCTKRCVHGCSRQMGGGRREHRAVDRSAAASQCRLQKKQKIAMVHKSFT